MFNHCELFGSMHHGRHHHGHKPRCWGKPRHHGFGYGHGPHAHGPHGHGPHAYGPHGHGPHGHGPHGFGSHCHGPHGHGPYHGPAFLIEHLHKHHHHRRHGGPHGHRGCSSSRGPFGRGPFGPGGPFDPRGPSNGPSHCRRHCCADKEERHCSDCPRKNKSGCSQDKDQNKTAGGECDGNPTRCYSV